ncbi:hypothetical protein [Fibrella aquatilis]|uniref:Uncharacterized protein n=1 Tax=Fibrella aquatilis TaxID=2817059 RepID=A0A939JYH2_9BACT|nr:hypothetical protein [Fibrella aquatilis]MBO0930368.1 hypothetical protein [Fibrella aquatilis]
MKEQSFYLQNPVTGQFHRLRGISPVGSPVALVQKPSGMALYHNSLSEAMAFANPGDTVLLLRDTREFVTLKNGVNINGNGYSLFSDLDGPLMTDGGQTVQCEVTNFERMESTFAGGVSEWNALVMVSGATSNITIQGKSLVTPATALNWNGKSVINLGTGATVTLRVKTIRANAVEVGGTNARVIIEDGRYISPMGASYTYRVTAGQVGRVIYNNMDIRVNNVLTFDDSCQVTFNACRLTSERNGLSDRGNSRYTFIDCQFLGQIKASWQAEVWPMHGLSATGSIELIGTNVMVAKGASASWLGTAAGSQVSIMGKVVANKPSPAANFVPTVGTGANGSILIDAATDLKFMQ